MFCGCFTHFSLSDPVMSRGPEVGFTAEDAPPGLDPDFTPNQGVEATKPGPEMMPGH